VLDEVVPDEVDDEHADRVKSTIAAPPAQT
jgi:hypothetical protein